MELIAPDYNPPTSVVESWSRRVDDRPTIPTIQDSSSESMQQPRIIQLIVVSESEEHQVARLYNNKPR